MENIAHIIVRWTLLTSFLMPSFSVVAAEKVEVDGVFYHLKDDGSAEVTFRGEEEDGWMYFSAEELYVGDVVIPDTVWYGGVSYRVTALGDDAFAGSKAMRSLSLPASVVSVGNGLFSLCNGLSSIQVAEENPLFFSRDGILYGKSPFSICFVPKAIVGDLVLPEGLTEIPSSAFQNCAGLTTVTLPEDVTYIADGAFSGCAGLQEIFMADGIVDIGVQAFSKCSNLTIVSIPSSVKRIQASAFVGCENLMYVILHEGLEEIGEMAFYSCAMLMGIELPSTLKTIGSQAFKGCDGLDVVKNDSSLDVVLGSTDHGYVAYYASQIISNDLANCELVSADSPSYYLQEGDLVVMGAVDRTVSVYSLSGQLLFRRLCVDDREVFRVGFPHLFVSFGK